MDRRTFVTTIAGGLLGASMATNAQQPPRFMRLGHLSIGTIAKSAPRGLVEAWAQYGWVEGKNFSVERRFAASPEQLLPLAIELAEFKLDLILTSGILAALALQKATRTIPVVFNVSDDPVEAGLVASIPHPGGNFTGVYTDNLIVEGKRLELIKEVLPRSRLVIYTPNAVHARTEAAAQSLGMRVRAVAASGVADLDGIFTALRAAHADAVVFSPVTWLNRGEILARIATECMRMKLPALGTNRGFANAGGLISFGPLVSNTRIAAKMDQILKGANPGDLPVEMPTEFELVFNLITADAIGVKISKALQFRATDNIRPAPRQSVLARPRYA